jgi:hypothetical protein
MCPHAEIIRILGQQRMREAEADARRQRLIRQAGGGSPRHSRVLTACAGFVGAALVRLGGAMQRRAAAVRGEEVHV